MATHSSVLAWRIPGTGEPGGLPSMGSHRVGHDWSDLAAAAAHVSYELKAPTKKKNWHPIFKSFIYTKVCQPSIWTNFSFVFFFFLNTISSSFPLLWWLFLPCQPRCWLLWLDQRRPFCVKTGVKKMLKSLCLLLSSSVKSFPFPSDKGTMFSFIIFIRLLYLKEKMYIVFIFLCSLSPLFCFLVVVAFLWLKHIIRH